MTIPTNPSFSRSGRSGPGGKHAELISTDMHGAEFSGIEQIQLVEPDDYASRQSRLHRESARSDRAASLELEREVCRVRPAKKGPARVPRDTEPCNLVGFIGIVAGEDYAIADIGLRMLAPAELYRAQGFPADYIIEWGIDAAGARVPLTKTAQVRMCGNSVCPPLAAALVRANVPEMAVRRIAA